MSDSSVRILYVVGKPSVGKSTICRLVCEMLAARLPAHVSIDDAHRALCPPGVKSDRYYYSTDGLLHLVDRTAIMKESLRWLARRCAELLSGDSERGIVCLEFSHHDYAGALLELVTSGAPPDAIIQVEASRDAAMERNRLRSALVRVPDDYMAAAFASASDCLSLVPTTTPRVIVGNDNGVAQSELRIRVGSALRVLGLNCP
jgi:adenylate kinase family enzyme